ncbi:MAG: phosphoglycerate kinase [Candidatus Micrarchaeota archaeon]
MDFLTLDDIEVSGKTVIVRVDINCPVDEKTHKISAAERIEGHAKTIKELASKGAKVVVLAHQGRKGESDFIKLYQHAGMLSEYVGKKVVYVPDLFGEVAKAAIKKMKNGEIILLENTRFFEGETEEKPPGEHAKGLLVANLAPLADYFVLDAFSAAHRSHASVVGFTKVLPSIAGRVMEQEVTSIAKAMENPKRPCVMVIGGAKPDDSMKIMGNLFEKGVIDKALLGGVIANVMLIAAGKNIGFDEEFMKQKGYMELIPKAKEFLAKYYGKIELPVDVAEDENGERVEVDTSNLPSKYPIKDIGKKTVRKYSGIISEAGTVIINGPMGVTEHKGFDEGTRKMLYTIAGSNAFSLGGGGHTIASIDEFGMKREIFGYISLAGKAFMESLVGKKLIGVEMLKESARKQREKR